MLKMGQQEEISIEIMTRFDGSPLTKKGINFGHAYRAVQGRQQEF